MTRVWSIGGSRRVQRWGQITEYRVQSTEYREDNKGGIHAGINSTPSTNDCITNFIMETPPKEASTSQYVLGVAFALIWMCIAGWISFGLFFVSVMVAGSNKAAHHPDGEIIGKLLMLFILLGAGLITFAGFAKKWEIFRWMMGGGLVLLAVAFLLFNMILN